MTPNEYDDEFISGDTYKIELTYKDTDGTPIDITNYIVRMQVKKSVNDEDTMADIYQTIERVDGVNGTIKITLDSSITECMISPRNDSTTYVYDIKLSNDTLTSVNTILSGKLTVYKAVTR